MSNHDHGPGCGCDPDEHVILSGDLRILYEHIDKNATKVLNATSESNPQSVIRPWNERNQDAEYVESDADEQLIVHITFTGSVKLSSIVVNSGPAGHTADEIKVYSNELLDFDDVADATPTQSFELPVTRGAVEFPVRPSKFPNVQTLTLFFPSNHGEDSTKLSFIGFKGDYRPLNKDPVVVVYEARANPADHAKIKGLDGVNSSLM